MSSSKADQGQKQQSNGITITYAGPESLIESGPFSRLLNAFFTQLPLRNLHWKPSSWSSSQSTSPASSNAFIRTIQTLPARLEPFSDTTLRTKLKPETRHLVQKSLLERPFCHLFFVIGDDSDAYRTHIRNDIRTWLNTIQTTPTLSAATVTARGIQQNVESVAKTSNGGTGSPRSGTPPIRPDTPTRNSLSEDVHASGSGSTTSSSSKEKGAVPSPEYLIVVITPPEGSPFASTTSNQARAASPMPSGASTPNADPNEKPAPAKTGLGRFYSSSSSSNSTSTKGSIVEKVKADFNTSKKERVIHLNRLPNLSQSGPGERYHIDPTIFAELVTKLKDCVTMTFDAVVGLQDDAVRKELSKKDVPGWNYNKWMAGMECLASTFEAAGLYTESLSQYEEIHSIFQQCLAEGKLPYFNQVGGTTKGDDSAPLLDTDRKDYRDLILRNEISLFDFRSYLFARRAFLLGKMGRILQVMSETPIFLQNVALMLQGETLPNHFIESWTFSAAIDMVEQCQAWLIERGDVRAPGMDGEDVHQGSMSGVTERIADSQLNPSFHAAKAELLDLARRQLDRIGISVGHLPNAAPFSQSLSRQNFGQNRDLPPLPIDKVEGGKSSSKANGSSSGSGKITRKELIEALESREVFDLRYIALTERVLAGWISSSRRRNVLRLRFVLASLDFFRERFTNALTALISMTEPYAEGKWNEIESIQLARELECFEKLNKDHDKEWMGIAIALARVQQQWSKNRASVEVDSAVRWMDQTFLYNNLRSHSNSMEEATPVSRFDIFQVDILGSATRIDSLHSGDGFMIPIDIESKLEAAIEVDDVRLCISNGGNGDLWFTSGKTILQKGKARLELFCTTNSMPGDYVIEVSQIRLGKIIFQYVHRQDLKAGQQDSLSFSRSSFITIPEDGEALEVSLDWAPHVFLDRSRTGVLTIFTGRNELEELDLRLKLTSSDVDARGLSETVFQPPPKSKSKMTALDDKVKLKSLSAHSKYILLIPFHEVNGIADGALLVSLSMQYWAKGVELQESTANLLQREIKLPLGLPLGVNVQDFFRHDRLLSKFLISAGAAGPLRLADVALWSEVGPESSAYFIETPKQDARCIVTLSEPASFVFAIRKNEKIRDNRTPLKLTLVYRTAYEEAVNYLSRALDQISEADKSITYSLKRCLSRSLWKASQIDLDLQAYSEKSQFRLHSPNKQFWSKTCKRWCNLSSIEGYKHIIEIIGKMYTKAQELADEEAKNPKRYQQEEAEFEIGEILAGRRPWRKLSLPVEVPIMTMVNAVKFDWDNTNIRVGVPIEVNLEIITTFAWDAPLEEEEGKNEFLSAKPYNVNIDDDGEGDDFEDAQSDVSGRSPSPLSMKGNSNEEIQERLEISVDINCDFVNWLLIGTKRKIISLNKPKKNSPKSKDLTQKNSIQITLVALQSGEIVLPTVSIWPLAELTLQETPPSNAHRQATSVQSASGTAVIDSGKPGGTMTQATVSSDTFITNEAQHVHVLPRHALPPNETFWISV